MQTHVNLMLMKPNKIEIDGKHYTNGNWHPPGIHNGKAPQSPDFVKEGASASAALGNKLQQALGRAPQSQRLKTRSSQQRVGTHSSPNRLDTISSTKRLGASWCARNTQSQHMFSRSLNPHNCCRTLDIFAAAQPMKRCCPERANLSEILSR